MSALILYLTTPLIGAFWTFAQWDAAKKEFQDTALVKKWTIASALLFLMILTCTLALGASGFLKRFELMPLPILVLFALILSSSAYIARSRFGDMLVKHTPLTWLVGFHAFRILAEMTILSGFHEGVAPRALSFHGANFDIVTGLTAIPVAMLANKHPKLVWWWNSMALAFLVVIAFIAMTSMPVPFRVFTAEPGNQWVTRLPYTLLPGVLVTAAISGQFLVYRKLRFQRS
jgi:hypothetical protein